MQRLFPNEDFWCHCGSSIFLFVLGLPLTCPGPVLPRHAGTPGVPTFFWASMGWGQLDTGPGAPSHFRERVFRPNPGIKGHLSIPRCPAPAFPNNIPLCLLPRLLQPPPLSTLPPFTASVVGLFVCRAGFLLFFSFLSPSCTLQANPLWWHRVWDTGGGLGAEAESTPGACEHPRVFSDLAEEGAGRALVGTALEMGVWLAVQVIL